LPKAHNSSSQTVSVAQHYSINPIFIHRINLCWSIAEDKMAAVYKRTGEGMCSLSNNIW